MKLFNKAPVTYAVIGLGRFGSAVAETLAEAGQEIILVDKDPEKVRDMRRLTDFAYVIEHIDQKNLEDIGVGECEVAIICIGSAMDANILTTLYCINLQIPKVIAKANSLDQGAILEKLGASVIYPERDMGKRLANQLLNKKMIDYFSVSGNMDIAQMKIPTSFIGQELITLRMRQRWGISVIAIMTGNGNTIEEIDPHYVFHANDSIIIIGSNENIHKFELDTQDD